MKTFKRIIASTVAALMILASLLTVNVFADAVAFTDVPADYYYKTAIDSLVANGVINGYTEEDGTSTFRPENTITRAEFAKLVAAATAKGVALTETTAQFPDVPADHWANTYIAYAVKAGIVNGYEDGTFRPSNPVTYGEAIKMLVCVKGYASVYTATNPWYDGWIQIANKISLTKNAMALGANPAPRGLVAQLVYNLDYCTKIEITTGSGGFNVSGGVDDEDDELEEATGMVVGVFETTLTGENMGLNKYQIMIGSHVYDISKSDYTIDHFYKYLGYEADVKYEEGSKRILKDFEEISPEKITISADDINDIDGNMIEYYASEKANKVTEAKLSSDLYVVYNGYGVSQSEIDSEFIEEYLFIDNGEITLMNSVGGKEYDVAWVTSYETYYVTSASLTGDIFKVKDGFTGKEISFNRKDCVGYRVTSTDLKKAEIADVASMSSIASKSILSIAKPYDRTEGTEIIICTAKLTGEVKEIVDYDEITIGEDLYKASNYFYELEKTDPDTYGFSNGDKGTFYLDYAGNIVYYTKSESNDAYAYVLGFDKGSGFDAECEIYIMPVGSSTGKVLGFNNTVKVNGSSMKPAELGELLETNAARIIKYWNGMTLENADYAQLVRYKASGNVLTDITTIDADNLANGGIVPGQIDTGDGKDYFSTGKGLKVTSTSGSTRTFVNDSGSTQFVINSSTKVLEVSKDRGSDESVKTKSYSHFSSTTANYVVEPYDIKSGVAKVVLLYVGTASKVSVYTGNNVAFVEKISSKKNDEGETVQVLTYYYAGETSTKETYAEAIDTIPSNIKPGDMIRLAIENNEIIGVQSVFVGGVLYDYSTSDVYEPIEATGNYIEKEYNDDTDYYNVIYGTVHTSAIEENAGTITVVPTVDTYKESEANAKTFDIKSSTKIYKWDDDNDTLVTDVAASEIYAALNETTFDCEAATKVVIATINNTIKCVYIIEE